MRSVNLTSAVLGILAVGVVLNILQFPVIEREVSRNWRAWNNYETSELDRYPHAERRYGFFLTIAELAPGATLIAPPPRPPTPTRLESFRPQIWGLGRLADMEIREYDPIEVGESVEVDSHVVAEGPRGSDQTYRIAMLNDRATTLVFLMTEGEDLLVVDLRLMPDGPPGEPRE